MSWKLAAILVTIVIVGTLFLIRCATEPPAKKERNYRYSNDLKWSSSEDSLFNKINEFRTKELGFDDPLIKSDLCYSLAQERCDQMITEYNGTGKVSHNVGFLTERIEENGGTLGRENIGYGFYSITTCFNAWKESPAHYSNMLGLWVWTGIAIKKDEISGKKFYCQVFAL